MALLSPCALYKDLLLPEKLQVTYSSDTCRSMVPSTSSARFSRCLEYIKVHAFLPNTIRVCTANRLRSHFQHFNPPVYVYIFLRLQHPLKRALSCKENCFTCCRTLFCSRALTRSLRLSVPLFLSLSLSPIFIHSSHLLFQFFSVLIPKLRAFVALNLGVGGYFTWG